MDAFPGHDELRRAIAVAGASLAVELVILVHRTRARAIEVLRLGNPS